MLRKAAPTVGNDQVADLIPREEVGSWGHYLKFWQFLGKDEKFYRMKPNETNKDGDPNCYQFFILNDTAPTAWWNFNKFVRNSTHYIFTIHTHIDQY